MKPDLIITSDWHIRDDVPICRTDDFHKSMCDKIQQIQTIQRDTGALVLNAGDICHTFSIDNSTINQYLPYFPDNMYSIPGNHDLKYHNIQNYADSTFSILANTGKLKYVPRFNYMDDTVVTCVPFGTSLKDIPERVNDKFNILMLHYFVYQEALPFDTHTCTTNELLTRLDYDLIITGDNHQTLLATVDNRTLINPGSISRQKADEATNKPCVFLYDIKNRTYKQVFLDCETEVITREHIEKETEREYRFEAFINKAKVTNETTMDVDDDLQKYFQENNTDPEVIEILMKAGAK